MPCARLLAPAALALLLATIGSAQSSVWTVDDDGPADFSDIQSAIDASTDGDAILVAAGWYPGFTLDGKGVTIVGEPNFTTVWDRAQILNLAPGQVAVLCNLNVILAGASGPEAFRAQDNQGSIRLQHCQLSNQWNTRGVTIADSDDVCLVDCVLRGGDGPYCGYGCSLPGASGAVIERSTIALYDCDVRGGDGDDSWGCKFFPGDGGHGASVVESFLCLSNSRFEGGDAGYQSECGCPWVVASGGNGIDLGNLYSELQILDSEIIGGKGGLDCYGNGWIEPPFANAGASRIVQIPGTRREMELVDHWQLDGTTLPATFRGEPGDSVYLPVDWGTAFAFDPAVKGTWILSLPATIPPTPIAVIPASGEIEVELPSTPPTGGNAGEVEYRQMYVVSATGETILGSPAGVLQVSACGPPRSYCLSLPNSSGHAAKIGLEGSWSVSAHDAELTATGCPPYSWGFFFFGKGEVKHPFGNGFLCISRLDGLVRLEPPTQVFFDGVARYMLDFSSMPPGFLIQPWNFQFWFRDTAAGGAEFNLSDAMSVTFCP